MTQNDNDHGSFHSVFTLYYESTQYEITQTSPTSIQIQFYNWTTPKPEPINFKDCPETIQDQILRKLNQDDDDFE